MVEDLAAHERSIYSQCGEDGVIERLFGLFGAPTRYFVEFGAKDGVAYSNTANLRLHHGWSGLLMDAGAPPDSGVVHREFVTAENVNALFARYAVPRSFDLLSIDIDGNDYWVWKALEYRPRVVVIEYNIYFDLHKPRTIAYDPDFVWDESLYHGASLAALRKLGGEKGYSLVYTDRWSPNAFFVLRSELPPDWTDLPIEHVTNWGHFDEPPDPEKRPWVAV